MDSPTARTPLDSLADQVLAPAVPGSPTRLAVVGEPGEPGEPGFIVPGPITFADLEAALTAAAGQVIEPTYRFVSQEVRAHLDVHPEVVAGCADCWKVWMDGPAIAGWTALAQ